QGRGTDFRVRALEALEASHEIDAIVVASSLAADGSLAGERTRLKEIAERCRNPILFYTYPLPSEAARDHLEAVGVPLYTSMRGAARALFVLVERLRAAERAPLADPTSPRAPRGYDDAVPRLQNNWKIPTQAGT